MQTKLLVLSFLFVVSCGNMKEVDDRKLESFSNITNAGKVVLDKSGTLQRGDGTTKDVVIHDGTSYQISIYSSYSSLEYVSARPLNYRGEVKFKGEVRGIEIVLESMSPL